MSVVPDLKIANAGHTMKVGDVEYTASMFSDRDYGDLTGYIRSRYLSTVMETASLMGEESRQVVIDAALNRLVNIGWGSIEGNNIIFSTDGVGLWHLGFQMIRKRHPKITYEKFEAECLKDPDKSAEKIISVFKLIAGIDSDSDTNSMDDNGGSSTENNKSE